MALHYSGGFGTLYDKNIGQPIARINYQIMETDATGYTKKRWWGEFHTHKKIKNVGIYRIELEDGRGGDCAIWTKEDTSQNDAYQYHYHFNGRSRLGKGQHPRRRSLQTRRYCCLYQPRYWRCYKSRYHQR